MEENNNIDQIFRKGINSLSEDPPMRVWDRLEDRLLIENENQKTKYRKRSLLLLSISVFCLISVFVCKNIFNYNEGSKEIRTNDITSSSSSSSSSENNLNTEIQKKEYSVSSTVFNETEKSKSNPIMDIEGEIKSIQGDITAKDSYQREDLRKKLIIEDESSSVHLPNVKLNNNKNIQAEKESSINISEKEDHKKLISNRDSQHNDDTNIESLNRLPSLYNVLKIDDRLIEKMNGPIQPFQQMKKHRQKFTLSVEKSLWSYGNRKLTDNAQGTDLNIDYFNSVEQSGKSSSIGIKLGYNLQNYSIETGVEYFQNSFIGTQYFFTTFQNNDYSEVLYTNSFNTNRFSLLINNIQNYNDGELISLKNNVQFSQIGISIPLTVYREINMGLLKVSIGLGLNINLPLSQKIEMIVTDDINDFRIDHQEDNAKLYMSYEGRLKFTYPVFKTLQITTVISHSRSFNSANKNKLVNFYPINSRLSFGVQTAF